MNNICHKTCTHSSLLNADRNTTEIAASVEAASNTTQADYRSCARIDSVLNFMDELYFVPSNGLGYHLLQADVIPQEYDLSSDNIDETVAYWSNYTLQTYDVSAFPAAVAQVGNQITLPNIFHQVVSSEFTTGSTEAMGVVSTYDLGVPINGYSSSSQATVDQFSDTGTWLWEEYDSFLKKASFEGVDVFFSDTENAMRDAETGYLAMESLKLFPASLLFVLFYLIYMQDSIFIGVVGMMQILLSFIPALILYRYLFGVDYLGVLNLIAIYIILGIGVDDLFVFCDQWRHHSHERRFDQRLQKTFNVASRAMFTTSCTTFISFISSAGSVFPAVSCFGLFAALLVLVNFCAIVLFFPAAFGYYYRFIRHRWYDHPSRLFCLNREPWTKDVLAEDNLDDNGANKVERTTESEEENSETKSEKEEAAVGAGTGSNGDLVDDKVQKEEDADLKADENLDCPLNENESRLVAFFRDTWAPLMIRLRFIVVVIFLGVLAGALVLTSRLVSVDDRDDVLLQDWTL